MAEHTRQQKISLFSLLPAVIATLLASAHILHIGSWLDLTLVNILCVPLIMLAIVNGLTEEVNVRKSFAFTSSLMIAGMETFLNFSADGINLEDFRLGALSLWSFGWVGMLLISALSFLTVLIRLLLWSQEKWMEVKQMHEAQRMEQRQFRLNRAKERRQRQSEARAIRQERLEQERRHSKEILQKRQAAEKEAREQKYSRQREARNLKLEKQKEKFKIWKEFVDQQRTERENGAQSVENPSKKLWCSLVFLITVFFLALFFWVTPYCVSSEMEQDNPTWIDHVVVFVDSLVGQQIPTEGSDLSDIPEQEETTDFIPSEDAESTDKKDSDKTSLLSIQPNPVQALIYYLLLYFVTFGAVIMLLATIWNILQRLFGLRKSEIDFSFATDYDLPIVILVVFIAILFVLGGIGYKFGVYQVSRWWEVLLLIIVSVITIFITIEVLLIVIKQCSEKASLLKELILLAFIVLLEFVGSLFISIILNFRIQSLISSLAAMIFMPDEEDTFADDVNHRIKCMFRRAARREPKEDHSFFKKANIRRRIWRR